MTRPAVNPADIPDPPHIDHTKIRVGSFTQLPCRWCGNHPNNTPTGCPEHQGRRAIQAADTARETRRYRLADQLTQLLGQDRDQLLSPLLTLCQFGQTTRDLTKAIGKVLMKLARPRRLEGRTERGIRAVGVHLGVAHHQSPSFVRAATRYVAAAVVLLLWQMQRRAWVRRAAVIAPRPSDTTKALTALRDAGCLRLSDQPAVSA